MVVCEVCCLICSTSKNKKTSLDVSGGAAPALASCCEMLGVLRGGRTLRPLRHLSPVDRAGVRKHAAFPGVQTECFTASACLSAQAEDALKW